ncbi:magnesium-translocating P-type ATPase [Chitinasiproducens palmae]|nr:magnesium-translocating P-type ATPase [Chitinasiproducens palmae]
MPSRHDTIDDTLQYYQSDREGLTELEAAHRLERDGPNVVAQQGPPSAISQLLNAFNNPFIAILVVLAAISACTDVIFADADERSYKSVIILSTMVLLSAVLRFVQEYRSERAAQALRALVSATATVLRRMNGTGQVVARTVPTQDLVVGDIVALSAGDMVPADVLLIESRNLMVSQAALSGESLPAEKYDTLGAVASKDSGTPAGQSDGSLLERPNVCLMGSNVVSGYARGMVIATGAQTYFGMLAGKVLNRKPAPTAFDLGVNKVSRLLICFMLVMVPIVFVLNGASTGDWLTAVTFALAVAVGLTPEMLPMVVSANLAKGALAMSRCKVVVKRLSSVQNFGAMDVLCVDKTGTLTEDRVVVTRHVDAGGYSSDEVLRLAGLNSRYQSGMRNVIDQAIVEAAQTQRDPDLAGWRKVDEIPFDFERRRLSVIVEDMQGEHRLICKGAVDEVLSVATSVRLSDRTVVALDATQRADLRKRCNALQRDGLRVLVLGSRTIPVGMRNDSYDASVECELVIEGMLTLFDPPKASAPGALAALARRGVAVKVLTGDAPEVARATCAQVGLDASRLLCGSDLATLGDKALRECARDTVVFAKLTPMDKARIVRALRADGHTVGFLGDGINDAPALRDADVGISVDSGADIAKETADIILLEKDLAVLETGVVKGRETFGNILKYLNITASSNFGNVFSVLIASALLPWEPILALQLLVVNLIYDTSQMLLPWDKMDPEFIDKPRKWDPRNIRRFMIWMGPTSSVFDITTFWLMWTVFGAGAMYHAGGGNAGQIVMNSGWFIESLVSQTMVVHVLRTARLPFIQSRPAWPVLISTSLAIVIGCALPYSPLGEAFGFVPMPASYWPWLALTMLGYITLAQVIKKCYIARYGQWF